MELRISGLTKTYRGGVRALDGVDLVVTDGLFGLLGPNGAGKTTLMRIIAGLQEVDGGTMTLDGEDVFGARDRIRRILGYLPQDFDLYGDVSAERLLGHIALLKGIANARERRETVRFLLEQTNLFEARSRKLGGFSGGMKQRFGIAQALMGDPRLIIVDEPTAGLDPEERNRFHNVLSDISESRIVILSTHIVDDVSVLCERFAVLDRGRILLASRVGEAVERLQGRVWSALVRKEELAAVEGRMDVILTRLSGGSVLVHVLGERRPEGFEAVEPDLFDAYFTAIREGRSRLGKGEAA